jgi:hypothetical protein
MQLRDRTIGVADDRIDASRASLNPSSWVSESGFGFQRVIRTLGVFRWLSAIGKHSWTHDPLVDCLPRTAVSFHAVKERRGGDHWLP